MNIFLNGTHVRSRVNLVYFKGVQLDAYETWYIMKLTCCTWDCLLEHGAHCRHITQNRDIFFWRNNWHIDDPWNISKISYWISFFFLFNTWFRYWIVRYFVWYIMQIVHIANWCTLLARARVWYEIIKKCWAQPWLSFGILQALRWSWEFIRFFWVFLLIQDFALKFWNMYYFSF